MQHTMATSASFRLINSLHAHEGPIRCAAFGPYGVIVTGCQSDAPNMKRWLNTDESIEEIGQSIMHDHWVTAVTALQPDSSRNAYQEGCIITGCQDSKIRVFSAGGELLQTLTGHGKGVVSFSWTQSGHLISGSWDGTAKIWDLASSACITTLGPHENGVQVLGLANNLIATTSTGESVNGKPANFKIRIWDPATGRQVGADIADHHSSIRCIAPLPAIDGFATTSNDGAVVMRSIDGTPIDVMQHPFQDDGSPAFVFGCCALESEGGMEVVSCGEDGSVLVWSGGELVQSLPHPCCVWAVKAVPGTGDFLTCGDDGVLRIFSRDPTKTSSDRVAALNEEFALEVSESQRRKNRGPSSEEIAKAPKWENRFNSPGKSADQVMVFNKDGQIVAAQWISGAWVIVGTVTGSGDGGYLNEVWYDHIMPVEIEGPTGVQTLKLGHNNGENAFSAAQRFIDANQLNQGYLGQIADWITARSGASMPTLGATGASNSSAGYTTPSSSAPAAKNFTYKVVALSTFDDVPPMPKLIAKMTEFSTALGGEGASASEVQVLEALTRTLSETSYYHSSRVPAAQLQALLRLILTWAPMHLFPLFDVLRVVCIHPAGADTLATELRTPLLQVVQRALSLLSAPVNDAEIPFSTLLTATRFLCNAAKMESLRSVVYAEAGLPALLNALLMQTVSANKLVRVAVSRIAMNLAGFATSTGVFSRLSLGAQSTQLLTQVISAILRSEAENAEVVFGVVRALGTLELSGKLQNKAEFKQQLVLVQQRWGAAQLGELPYACLVEALALF